MMKNKWKITAAAILGTAGILTAGYLYWCTTLDDKVIWKDVSINGVALQGKTIEAAEKAVQEQFKKDYQDSEITVSLAENIPLTEEEAAAGSQIFSWHAEAVMM